MQKTIPQPAPQFTERTLTPQEQSFYNTMAAHYEDRVAEQPGVQLLADKARTMRETATRGTMRVEMLPDPNDLDVLL